MSARSDDTGRPGAWVAHVLVAVAVVLAVAGVWLTVATRSTTVTPNGERLDPTEPWQQLALAIAYGVGGWLLAHRRPRVIFGWLALGAAIGHAAGLAGQGWALYALTEGRHLPGAGFALWTAYVGEPLENPIVAAVWATFPDGRLPRGPIRWPAVASVALCGVGWLYGMLEELTPTPVDGLTSPIGVLPYWPPEPLFLIGLLLGSIVLVIRWLRARGRLRQVLRWLAVVNLASIAVTPLFVVLPAGDLISTVEVVLLLIVVTVVVLANQVYGIEVVLNRALVYTLLTVVVAALYGTGVGVLALLGENVGGPWTIVVAIAAAFSLAPARQRVQRLVNRFLYGERDEPYAVIGRLATRLEATGTAEQLLPSLLESIVDVLRLPSAAVEMRGQDGSTRRIAHGADRPDGGSIRFPLVHQGDQIGALVIGLRPGQDALGPRETRLMRDIARQVAVAASNVVLTEALIQSRERIVHTAEEERRRLRHDLHDGLGPVLTAAASKVDASRNLLAKDLPRAGGLLDSVRGDLGTALGELRRLVYALRPPVLDELGLSRALAEQLEHAAIPVRLTCTADLSGLPAAVEIAAYRIVTEAVTNVARHAGASLCEVTISRGGRLTLDIRDDGPTIQPWTPGVGLTSMRERATALGGVWQAGPTSDGGRVHVELPLSLAGGTAVQLMPSPADGTAAQWIPSPSDGTAARQTPSPAGGVGFGGAA